jgi:hypothetical protein
LKESPSGKFLRFFYVISKNKLNMAKHMSDSNIPTHEQITQRAYEIFIERGRPEGRDLEHWLEAEKQLRAAGSKKTAQLTATSNALSTPSTTPTPMRATQSAPTASSRPSGNGRGSSRTAARK